MRWTLSLLTLTFTLGLTAPVRAGGGFATEVTQLANNLQLLLMQSQEVQQVAHQALMVANQLTMIQDRVRQGQHLGMAAWGQTLTELQDLARAVSHGQALSYTLGNLDGEYRRRYPGYDAYLGRRMSHGNFQTQYRTWRGTTLDTIQAALKAAKLQADQFHSEEATLVQLQALSQSAVGRMQALQAGNQIAAQHVRQLQKLRQLSMTQIQMHAAYLAAQEDQDAAQQAAFEKFMTPARRPVIGNEERY